MYVLVVVLVTMVGTFGFQSENTFPTEAACLEIMETEAKSLALNVTKMGRPVIQIQASCQRVEAPKGKGDGEKV